MLEKRPGEVKIVEVGPRDGLQNETHIVPLEKKISYIQKLVEAGLTTIEATSFVRPDRIRQMGDADKLFSKLKEKGLINRANFPCLVPNEKGMQNALKVGVKEIAFFTATSETFNQKNINASIDESFERLKPIAEIAKTEGIKIRAYVSTVFGCPYEGETSLEKLLTVVENLKKFGVYEISLGDTIGVGEPLQIQKLLRALKAQFDGKDFALHFHDTYGLALTNIVASLEEGMSVFDASSGGLGGCPYAKGATGNVATEDVVYLMSRLGIKSGVDLQKLYLASHEILREVGKESPSKVFRVMEQNEGKLKGFT